MNTMDQNAEIERLRARVAQLEQADRDRRDPNVLLLEGEISHWEGEYGAWSVATGTGRVYLAEVIEQLVDWQGSIATFQWHISSEPLGFYELEEHLVQTAMGKVKAEFSHAYSDLTGYLWTNESVKLGDRDLLEEIAATARSIGPRAYIALRVEKGDGRK